MTLALNMEKVDELGAASTVSVYTVTITIRAKDIHDLESTRDVVITIVPHSDQLAFQLATGDGVNRHWGDPLWSGGSALAAGSANSYLNANIDIRTQSFATMHLGPRIRFEWVLAGDVKATAIYNVFPQYQQKTWLELFSGGWNQHIASKDTLASTPGRPLVDAGFVRNANGNNGQQVGAADAVVCRPLLWMGACKCTRLTPLAHARALSLSNRLATRFSTTTTTSS